MVFRENKKKEKYAKIRMSKEKGGHTHNLLTYKQTCRVATELKMQLQLIDTCENCKLGRAINN